MLVVLEYPRLRTGVEGSRVSWLLRRRQTSARERPGASTLRKTIVRAVPEVTDDLPTSRPRRACWYCFPAESRIQVLCLLDV